MIIIPQDKVEVFSECSHIEVEEKAYPILRPKITTYYNGPRTSSATLPYKPILDISYLSDKTILPMFSCHLHYLGQRIYDDCIFESIAINADNYDLHRYIHYILMKININIITDKCPNRHSYLLKKLIIIIHYNNQPVIVSTVRNIYDILQPPDPPFEEGPSVFFSALRKLFSRRPRASHVHIEN
jgi:hypothetical protein